jgi:hypothetical protein
MMIEVAETAFASEIIYNSYTLVPYFISEGCPVQYGIQWPIFSRTC